MGFLNGIIFLLFMLIAWSALFSSGSGSFYEVAINATMVNPDVPDYFKVGLIALPAVGYLGILVTFIYLIQGQQRPMD
jgi:hypothetical protein